MPFIHTITNRSMTDTQIETLKQELGQAITAIRGKSEAWLMVQLEPDAELWFQGTDEPCAMVEVTIYGGADDDEAAFERDARSYLGREDRRQTERVERLLALPPRQP